MLSNLVRECRRLLQPTAVCRLDTLISCSRIIIEVHCYGRIILSKIVSGTAILNTVCIPTMNSVTSNGALAGRATILFVS